ncbi:DUF2141 domain-containing protein [Pseudomonas alcaligenes]|uniref:DUF2141 domain-containing protein n=1 Tax=Aquipseudomonas alcaligenes TaxID=43263 RepID=UPI00358F4D91
MPQRFLQTVTWPCLAALLFVSSPVRAGDIVVRVEGIQASGNLYLALAPADRDDWGDRPLQQLHAGTGELRLPDVPPGRYAVQLYQDSNGNGRLDLSPRGVPQEPVGFSGNPSLLKGKPSPRACLFTHGEADSLVTLRLQAPRKRR